MFKISNLHASVEDTEILKGIDLVRRLRLKSRADRLVAIASAKSAPEATRKPACETLTAIDPNNERAQWLAQQKKDADNAATTREEYIMKKSGAYEVITREALEWASRRMQSTPDGAADAQRWTQKK